MMKHLDFFSEGVNLNVGGHAVFRTPYGSLFTVVYGGVMIYIVILALQRYFDKTRPIAATEIISTQYYPKVNLYDNKMMPVLIAWSNEIDSIPASDMDKYFTIKYSYIDWITTTNPITKVVTLEKKITEYPAVPCSTLTAEEMEVYEYMGTDNNFYQNLEKYGICGKIPKDLTIEGRSSDTTFNLFSVKLLPCVTGSSCATAAEMALVNFNLLIPSSKLDVADADDPHDFTINADDLYYVNVGTRQLYTGKMKEFSIYDYEGFLPQWVKELTIYDIGQIFVTQTSRTNVVSCSAADIAIPDNPNCLPYFEFNVQSGGSIMKNKRTYITIFETLSSIGGTNGVIIIVLLLVYRPINERKRKEHMTRKIFSAIGVKEENLEKGLQYLEAQQKKALRGENAESPERLQLPLETQTTEKPPEEKRKWWQCCCCRKKTQSEIDWENYIKKADDLIIDSLDVMSILRNFNQLKVLTHFFFDQKHFDLAQYVGFDLWQKEVSERNKKLREERGEDEQGSARDIKDLRRERRHLRKLKVSRRILNEKQKFNYWLDQIRDIHNNRKVDNSQITNGLSGELDEFFYKKLHPNHGFKTQGGMFDLITQLMRDENVDDVPEDDGDDRHAVYMPAKRLTTGAPREDLPTYEMVEEAQDRNQQNRDEERGQGMQGLGGIFGLLANAGQSNEQNDNAARRQSSYSLNEGAHHIPSSQEQLKF